MPDRAAITAIHRAISKEYADVLCEDIITEAYKPLVEAARNITDICDGQGICGGHTIASHDIEKLRVALKAITGC
jgi:hypothetical protein